MSVLVWGLVAFLKATTLNAGLPFLGRKHHVTQLFDFPTLHQRCGELQYTWPMPDVKASAWYRITREEDKMLLVISLDVAVFPS